MNDEENTPRRVLSPVPTVPVVPSVPLEGDKEDKGDKGDRGQQRLSDISGFNKGKSEKDRFAILLYDHPNGLTYKAAAAQLNIHPDTIKRYGSRLNEQPGAEWLQPIGTSSPQHYTLTPLGRAEIQKAYFAYERVSAEQRKRVLLVEQSTIVYQQVMDLPTQIEKFQEFFALHEQYLQQLLQHVRDGHPWVDIAFNDLAKFSPELAELLLQQPDEVFKAWQLAIDKLDLATDVAKDLPPFTVRITQLPTTIRLSSLGTDDIDQLIQVEAQVLTVGERRPVMLSARFECPSCDNIMQVLQVDQKYREPSRCICGRKGKFKLLTPELVNACTVLLTQPLSELVGKKIKPSQVKVFLKNDLTRDDVRDHLGLNSMVRIVGILRKLPIILPSGGQSTRFDVALDAVSVTLLDHYNPTLALSPERIEQFKQDVLDEKFKDRMIQSFFPRHVGDDSLKMQLLCMSVAMPLHLNSLEAKRQAECEALNIIVAGDPGMGKSNLGRRVLELCPHGGRATGAGASKAGLTIAADNKDKENDLIIPQPGAIPNANMGIFLLDELDKMEINEQTVLNEALADHTVTITKRGVNTTLPANICFIGFANPRVKTWDLSKQKIENELNINYTLMTRCIMNIQTDHANEQKDRAVAQAVLQKDQTVLAPFDDAYIQDFLPYVRATVFPKLRPKERQAIEDVYVELRKLMPIKSLCPRFVEQVRSLTLLHAKLHLRKLTCKEDVTFATETLRDSLVKSGYDDVGLRVTEVNMHSPQNQMYAYIQSQTPYGAKLLDLYNQFPDIDIQRMLRNGNIVEWKSGFVRVHK